MTRNEIIYQSAALLTSLIKAKFYVYLKNH